MVTTIVQTAIVDSPIVEVDSMGYNGWWLPCGCAPSDCQVAYAAKGAGSLANSLINLNNPGVKDLIYDNAPAWDDVDGWAFDGIKANGFLYSSDSIHIDANITCIVKFSNYSYPNYNNHYLFGGQASVNTFGLNMIDDGGSPLTDFNLNVPHVYKSVNYTSGILAVKTTDMLKDGTSVSPLIEGGPFLLDLDIMLGIGGIFTISSPYMMIGNIQAIAIYYIQLTDQQIIDVGNAMP